MSTNLHFAMEVRKNGKWRPLEWYSTYESFYNRKPSTTPLLKRYYQFFSNYNLHMKLLKYKWWELPKAMKYTLDGYIKDKKDEMPYEPTIKVGDTTLYKHMIMHYDHFLFRDYFIRSSADSTLSGRGLPEDVSEDIAKYAKDKWCHSRTHFMLGELWSICEKEENDLIERMSKRTNNRLLLNIANKVGADTDVELGYEDYTNKEWFDEIGEKYYAATRTYYALLTVLEENAGYVSEDDVRVIVWAS